MGKIEIDHTGSGGGITLSSDGTDLLLDGSAVGGSEGAGYPADQSFTVTNSGSGAYTFAGGATGDNATLTLIRGRTYKFSINASGHPFRINTSNTTGTSAAYVNGTAVINNGAAVGDIYFTVPDTAPDTLYYNCEYHSSMAGTINVSNVFVIDKANDSLLVGMTTDNITSTGIGLVKDGVSHMYSAVSGANATLMLGRGGSDGNVLSFNRSGTTFGNIGGGTSTGELVISTNSGIGYISQKLTGDTDGIQYSNVGTYHVGPWISKNNTIDLGRSNSGWRDLYLTGGIQFDAQSNKLDDYEEGLHTFTLKGANSGSATIPIRSGYTKLAYTKIGRMVTITGKIETLGSHSTSGALRLSLPFTAANLSDQAGVAGGSCFIYRTSQSIYDNPAILPSSTAPYAIFYYNTTSGDVAAINANNLDAAFEILVNFSYFTT